MKKLSLIAIDLVKNSFQPCVLDIRSFALTKNGQKTNRYHLTMKIIDNSYTSTFALSALAYLSFQIPPAPCSNNLNSDALTFRQSNPPFLP